MSRRSSMTTSSVKTVLLSALVSRRLYVVLVGIFVLCWFTSSTSDVNSTRQRGGSVLTPLAGSSSTLRQHGWSWDWLPPVQQASERIKQGLTSGLQRYYHGQAYRYQGGGEEEQQQQDDGLSYRQHLETAHAPYRLASSGGGGGGGRRSPTLSFDHIYVISLKHRTDRRERMLKMAKALGLRFTIFDATSKDEPFIGWIAQRVKEIKDWKRPILAKALGKKQSQIGGLGVTSVWLRDANERPTMKLPDLRKIDKRWKLSGDQASDSGGQQVVDWVTYLQRSSSLSTDRLPALAPDGVASMEELNVTDLLYDPLERQPMRQINEGVIATWHSQTSVWRKMIENDDRSVLIMEDDVDIEWDIERIWPNVERSLPKDWEIVFLGHCWGRELANPQYVNPRLHRAREPRCLHGYALSQRGARHLVKLTSDPWKAYIGPIDTFIPYLTRQSNSAFAAAGRSGSSKSAWSAEDGPTTIQAFSMEPPIIIQAKEMSSDIQGGTGSRWRGLLEDSTWDRILRDEGVQVKQLTWEDTAQDPAIKARPWGKNAKTRTNTVTKTRTEGATFTLDPAATDDEPTLVVTDGGAGGDADHSELATVTEV